MKIITDYAVIGRKTARFVPVVGPTGTAEKIEHSDIKMLGYASSTAIMLYDILIDCACSVKAIQEAEENGKKIRAVFLTHRHSDHVSPAVLQHIAQRGIPIYGNQDTANAFSYIPITVIKEGDRIETPEVTVVPYNGKHTVPVFVYTIQHNTTQEITLVAVDTKLTEDIWQDWWKQKIDRMIIEYRYIEERLKVLKAVTVEGAKYLRAYHHQPVTDEPISNDDFKALEGHASKEEAWRLYEWCRHSESSPWIKLSRGTFYCD